VLDTNMSAKFRTSGNCSLGPGGNGISFPEQSKGIGDGVDGNGRSNGSMYNSLSLSNSAIYR